MVAIDLPLVLPCGYHAESVREVNAHGGPIVHTAIPQDFLGLPIVPKHLVTNLQVAVPFPPLRCENGGINAQSLPALRGRRNNKPFYLLVGKLIQDLVINPMEVGDFEFWFQITGEGNQSLPRHKAHHAFGVRLYCFECLSIHVTARLFCCLVAYRPSLRVPP